VVWAVTIPIFWYVTLHTLGRANHILPTRWRRALDALTRYHTVVLTLWTMIVLTLIAHRFWSYWSQLLTP
ncbi:MAG: vitamin K epoxide reductase family protein, partial [Pseudonocardiaceae bacterium]